MKTLAHTSVTSLGTLSSGSYSAEHDTLTAPIGPGLGDEQAPPAQPANATEADQGHFDKVADLVQRLRQIRELWEKSRRKQNDRIRESNRRVERFEYAAQIRDTEHREVRSYLPSTPERRQQQKAASKARRDAVRSEEEREAIRKKDRERKARKREEERLIAEIEAMDFDLE